MRYSVLTMLIGWLLVAWLTASLFVPNPWVSESFIAFQYLLFAIFASLAVAGPSGDRLISTCFALGFLTWSLLLVGDSLFANSRPFLGSCMTQVTFAITDFRSFPDLEIRQQHQLHVSAVIRATMGTAIGVLTYLARGFSFDLARGTTSRPTFGKRRRDPHCRAEDEAKNRQMSFSVITQNEDVMGRAIASDAASSPSQAKNHVGPRRACTQNRRRCQRRHPS